MVGISLKVAAFWLDTCIRRKTRAEGTRCSRVGEIYYNWGRVKGTVIGGPWGWRSPQATTVFTLRMIPVQLSTNFPFLVSS